MSKANIIKILLSPQVSEKTSRLELDRQYAFRVHQNATKPEIKAAAKSMFNVDVLDVKVCNVRSKKRRFGNIQGKRKGWKKAYITLKEGQAIKLGGA